MCFLCYLFSFFFKEKLYTEVKVGGWCLVPALSLFTSHLRISGTSVSPWTFF